MAKRRSRITYAPKSRRKSSGSNQNQSAPTQGIGLKEKVAKSKGTSVPRSCSSQDPGEEVSHVISELQLIP